MMDAIRPRTRPLAAASRVAEQARYEAVVAPMLDGSMGVQERAAVMDAASAYRLELLEDLRDAGYRIEFTNLRVNTAGLHDGKKKKLSISRLIPTGDHRRVILHEMAHAIDSRRFEKSGSWLKRRLVTPEIHFATQRDDRILSLYQDYQLQASVDMAGRVRDEMVRKSTAHLERRHLAGAVSDDLVPGTTETLVETRREEGVYVTVAVPAAITAMQVGLGAALVAVLPAAAPACLAIGAISGWSTYASWRQKRENERFEALDGQVRLADGSTRKVHREGDTEVIETPPAGHKDARMFSPYALQTRKVYEYYAEGVAAYLESSQTRERLEQMDPGLHGYIAGQGLDAQGS